MPDRIHNSKSQWRVSQRQADTCRDPLICATGWKGWRWSGSWNRLSPVAGNWGSLRNDGVWAMSECSLAGIHWDAEHVLPCSDLWVHETCLVKMPHSHGILHYKNIIVAITSKYTNFPCTAVFLENSCWIDCYWYNQS